MAVHFQGMSKTLSVPPDRRLQGAPTCSIGISHEGFVHRFNDAGRLILMNQNAIQLGLRAVYRVEDSVFMLTTKNPAVSEEPDTCRAEKLLSSAVSEKQVSISIATPLLEWPTHWQGQGDPKAGFAVLSGDAHALMPVGVEEYEVKNTQPRRRESPWSYPDRPGVPTGKGLKAADQDTGLHLLRGRSMAMCMRNSGPGYPGGW